MTVIQATASVQFSGCCRLISSFCLQLLPLSEPNISSSRGAFRTNFSHTMTPTIIQQCRLSLTLLKYFKELQFMYFVLDYSIPAIQDVLIHSEEFLACQTLQMSAPLQVITLKHTHSHLLKALRQSEGRRSHQVKENIQ